MKIMRYLPSLYKYVSPFSNFVDTVICILDEIETKWNECKRDISIRTAVGNAIDEIGKIFKLSRTTGETDTAYRQRVTSAFQLFTYASTITAMKKGLSLYLGFEEDDITVEEIRPLVVKLTVSVGSAFDDDAFTVMINKVKPAGVYVTVSDFNMKLDEVLELLDPADINQPKDGFIIGSSKIGDKIC